MVTIPQAGLLLAVLAFAGGLPRAAAQEPPAATISGRVEDGATRVAIPAATVVLVSSGRGASRRATSDTDGRFHFDNVPGGKYSIQVTKAGYSAGGFGQRIPTDAQGLLDVAPGAKREGLTIPIWRLATLSGRLRDARGGVAVGATVSVLSRRVIGGRERFSVAKRATTDEQGAFQIPNVASGQYLLAARPAAAQKSDRGSAVTFFPASPLANTATRLDVRAGEDRADLDFSLLASGLVRVSGVVTRSDQQPAAGLTVRLIAAPNDDVETELDVMSVRTSDTGSFAFAEVPPGHYVVRVVDAPRRTNVPHLRSPGVVVTATGRGSGVRPPVPLDLTKKTWWREVPIHVGTKHVTGVAVELQAGYRLSGRLRFEGASARPSPDAIAALQLAAYPVADPDAVEITPVAIDAEAVFRSPELPGGSYAFAGLGSIPGWTITAIEHRGQNLVGRAFSLTSDLEDVLVVLTDRPSSVSGSVTDQRGVSAGDSWILVFPSDHALWQESGLLPPSRFKRLTPGADGRYEITLLPGDYSIVALKRQPPSDWQHPGFLKQVAAAATAVSIREGDRSVKNLRVRDQ